MILARKHRVPIGIGQGDSVLEVTGDVLSLEGGILYIARLNLLVERTVREFSDIWSMDIGTWREELRQDPENQHDASDKKDKIQYSPVIIGWAPAITAIASIVGALRSSRALIMRVALVQMYRLSIH